MSLFHECPLPGCRGLTDAPEPCGDCLSSGYVAAVAARPPRFCPLLVDRFMRQARAPFVKSLGHGWSVTRTTRRST